MRILWLMPPSQKAGQIPLVSQNRWFKYMPSRANFIYPVLAAYGVSMLLEAGFDVKFMDCPAEEISLRHVLDVIPDYDLLVLEGRTPIMPWLWQLIMMFKDVNPRLKVAAYGDHVMIRAEESLFKGVDFVVSCGDWDLGVLKLAQALDNNQHPPSIFHCNMLESLDDLPLLNRDAVPWRNYYESWRHRDEFGWIQSGRGCWAKCSYCSWNHTFYGCKIRTASNEAVFNEISHAHRVYGIREFLDDADTFMLKPLGVYLAHRFAEAGMDILWNCQTRADVVNGCSISELEMMRENGLRIVKLGADAASDYSLKMIRKGCSAAQIREAVERLKHANIEIHINMILGYPWETKRQAYETIRFVKNLKPNQAQFGLIQPFIGTPLYDQCLEKGWFCIDPDDYERWNMKEPIVKGEMSAREISQLYEDAWRQFYFSPRYIAGQLWKSVRLCIHHRNLEALQHLWRGYKAVRDGHLRALEK